MLHKPNITPYFLTLCMYICCTNVKNVKVFYSASCIWRNKKSKSRIFFARHSRIFIDSFPHLRSFESNQIKSHSTAPASLLFSFFHFFSFLLYLFTYFFTFFLHSFFFRFFILTLICHIAHCILVLSIRRIHCIDFSPIFDFSCLIFFVFLFHYSFFIFDFRLDSYFRCHFE